MSFKLSQSSIRNRRRSIERGAFPAFINHGAKFDGSSLSDRPIWFDRWVPVFPMKAESGATTKDNVESCHVSLAAMADDKSRPNVGFSPINRKTGFYPVRTMVAYDAKTETAKYAIKYRPIAEPVFVPIDFSQSYTCLVWNGKSYKEQVKRRYYHDKVSAAKNRQILLDMADMYGVCVNNADAMSLLNELKVEAREYERANYRRVHNAIVPDIRAFFNAPLAKREKTINVEREQELALIDAYMAKLAANRKAEEALEKKAAQSNKARKRSDQKTRTRTPRTKHAAMLRRYSLKYMK